MMFLRSLRARSASIVLLAVPVAAIVAVLTAAVHPARGTTPTPPSSRDCPASSACARISHRATESLATESQSARRNQTFFFRQVHVLPSIAVPLWETSHGRRPTECGRSPRTTRTGFLYSVDRSWRPYRTPGVTPTDADRAKFAADLEAQYRRDWAYYAGTGPTDYSGGDRRGARAAASRAREVLLEERGADRRRALSAPVPAAGAALERAAIDALASRRRPRFRNRLTTGCLEDSDECGARRSRWGLSRARVGGSGRMRGSPAAAGARGRTGRHRRGNAHRRAQLSRGALVARVLPGLPGPKRVA